MFKFPDKVCAIRFFSLLNTVVENGKRKREQQQQQQQRHCQKCGKNEETDVSTEQVGESFS